MDLAENERCPRCGDGLVPLLSERRAVEVRGYCDSCDREIKGRADERERILADLRREAERSIGTSFRDGILYAIRIIAPAGTDGDDQ